MTRARRLGTEGENKVVAYLQANGHPYAERRALRGSNDKGDIAGVPGVVVEVKYCARMELAAWVDEAEKEGDNADAAVRVVWHRRKGKSSAGDWYVSMTGQAFLALLGEP